MSPNLRKTYRTIIAQIALATYLPASSGLAAEGSDGVRLQLQPIPMTEECYANVLMGTSSFRTTAFRMPKPFLSKTNSGFPLVELYKPTAEGEKYKLQFGVHFPKSGDSATWGSEHLVKRSCDNRFIVDFLNTREKRKAREENRRPEEIILAELPAREIQFSLPTVRDVAPYTLGGSDTQILDYEGTDQIVEFQLTAAQYRALFESMRGNIGLPIKIRVNFAARSSAGNVKMVVDYQSIADQLQSELGVSATAQGVVAQGAFRQSLQNIMRRSSGSLRIEAGSGVTPEMVDRFVARLTEEVFAAGQTTNVPQQGLPQTPPSTPGQPQPPPGTSPGGPVPGFGYESAPAPGPAPVPAPSIGSSGQLPSAPGADSSGLAAMLPKATVRAAIDSIRERGKRELEMDIVSELASAWYETQTVLKCDYVDTGTTYHAVTENIPNMILGTTIIPSFRKETAYELEMVTLANEEFKIGKQSKYFTRAEALSLRNEIGEKFRAVNKMRFDFGEILVNGSPRVARPLLGAATSGIQKYTGYATYGKEVPVLQTTKTDVSPLFMLEEGPWSKIDKKTVYLQFTRGGTFSIADLAAGKANPIVDFTLEGPPTGRITLKAKRDLGTVRMFYRESSDSTIAVRPVKYFEEKWPALGFGTPTRKAAGEEATADSNGNSETVTLDTKRTTVVVQVNSVQVNSKNEEVSATTPEQFIAVPSDIKTLGNPASGLNVPANILLPF